MSSIMNVVQATLLVKFVVICAAFEENSILSGAQGISQKGDPFSLPSEKVVKREKRYPQHLDPTLLKFWVQVGECPESSDGGKKYYCPSPTSTGKQVCIEDYQLCNGVKECPHAEDENRNYCFFYNALKAQVGLLEKSLAAFNTAHEPPPSSRSSSFDTFGPYYDYSQK